MSSNEGTQFNEKPLEFELGAFLEKSLGTFAGNVMLAAGFDISPNQLMTNGRNVALHPKFLDLMVGSQLAADKDVAVIVEQEDVTNIWGQLFHGTQLAGIEQRMVIKPIDYSQKFDESGNPIQLKSYRGVINFRDSLQRPLLPGINNDIRNYRIMETDDFTRSWLAAITFLAAPAERHVIEQHVRFGNPDLNEEIHNPNCADLYAANELFKGDEVAHSLLGASLMQEVLITEEGKRSSEYIMKVDYLYIYIQNLLRTSNLTTTQRQNYTQGLELLGGVINRLNKADLTNPIYRSSFEAYHKFRKTLVRHVADYAKALISK